MSTFPHRAADPGQLRPQARALPARLRRRRGCRHRYVPAGPLDVIGRRCPCPYAGAGRLRFGSHLAAAAGRVHQDLRSRFVQANGIRQHVVIGGEGRPLLLVHGWPENWYAWRLLMPAHHRLRTGGRPPRSGRPPGRPGGGAQASAPPAGPRLTCPESPASSPPSTAPDSVVRYAEAAVAAVRTASARPSNGTLPSMRSPFT